ncbi:hypothetical protein [Barrientosiimonas humi]|uniref:hypothetical protein n=1 Tax=Barrientosiimonas humi TaxID=999931 RepID=UPI00370DE1E6
MEINKQAVRKLQQDLQREFDKTPVQIPIASPDLSQGAVAVPLSFNAQRVLAWLLTDPERESRSEVREDVCPEGDLGAVYHELTEADLIINARYGLGAAVVFEISRNQESRAKRATRSYRDNLAQTRVLTGVQQGLDAIDRIVGSDLRHDFSGEISADEFRDAAEELLEAGHLQAVDPSAGDPLDSLAITRSGRRVLQQDWAPADLSGAGHAAAQHYEYKTTITGHVGAVQQGSSNTATIIQNNQLAERMRPTLEAIREQIATLPDADDQDVLNRQVDQFETAVQHGASPGVLKRMLHITGTAASDAAGRAAVAGAGDAFGALFHELSRMV